MKMDIMTATNAGRAVQNVKRFSVKEILSDFMTSFPDFMETLGLMSFVSAYKNKLKK